MKSDKKKDALLSMIRQGKPMTLGEQARLVMFLATPAILAQLTTTMMQYIDASMVGSMGAQASASIGLMETTMWLLATTQKNAKTATLTANVRTRNVKG